MKINYKYQSKFLSVIRILGVLVVLHPGIIKLIATHVPSSAIPMPSSAIPMPEDKTLVLMIFLMPIIIWLSCIALFSNLPIEMVADEYKLKVTVPFRETIISYSDIENISIDHEFRKAEIRGADDYYNEILTITDINKKKYVYHKKIELDQNKVAKSPAYLEKQFEKSEFSRLKRYIEEQMKFEKRLGINLQNIHGDR
ncbi:hypothetical protein [Ruminococcus sp.]|uniref:hypothetical protein n=1 Tax=Ruminococcus sp. TaxID=41978 RepID=UPI0025850BC5|nr:hypothetical protein [Ruminococcus sp.]MCR5020597.1 hypothetical protein [Ruminococcus sp.]